MTSSRFVALLVLVTFAGSGCAALFGSKKTTIATSSDPPGADVYVDGARMGTTPISLELSSKEEHTITFKKEGYKDVSCQLARSVGAGWVVLDILGGLVPIIFDATTSSWYGLTPKVCNLPLTPEGGGQ